MGLLIFITVLLTVINVITVKELTWMLKHSRLDNQLFYRLCLIPPIGFITYCFAIAAMTITVLIFVIMDIWKK